MKHLPDVIALLVASLCLVALFWPRGKATPPKERLPKHWRGWPRA